MSRRVPYILMISLSAFAVSPATADNERKQPAENRIELPGFSILPPKDGGWRPYSAPRQGILVMFSRAKNADQGAEKLLSFVLLGTSQFLELPYQDEQQLRQRLQETLRAKVRPELLKSLEVSSDPDEVSEAQTSKPITSVFTSGAQCIRYRMQSLNEERSSGQFLTLQTRGKLCLHPFHPAYVIDFSYSQRSRSGNWDNTFDSEAEGMLQSLAFEPVPLSDYVSARLQEYASLLDKINKESEASKIRKFAESLVKPETGGSTYLGFDGKVILNEYAALLRTQKNEVEAKRMENLGSRWEKNNLSAFLKQQSR